MRMRIPLLFSLILSVILVFGCASKPATEEGAAADANASGNAATAAAKPAQPAARPAATPAAPVVLVPEGTAITVRTSQEVGSKISRSGDTFAASVAEPVVVNGRTVIPAGASATGRVSEAQALGRVSGEARLSLRLESVEINGERYSVQSSGVTRIEEGKGKRSAAMIGGGAAAGAIIGGIAGGGKGAAIGAAAGAGAGTAGATLTGNKDIVIPAESALTFNLTAPVDLKR
jgi:hypothetical protein